MQHRIAIIEDDPLAAQTLAGVVRSISGGETRIITHPDGVSPALADWTPVLALLDLSLPGRSGEAVLEDLRRDHPHMPVVVTTGNDDPATVVRLMRAGAFDYLIKPFDADAVRASIERALRQAAILGEQGCIATGFMRRDRPLHAAFSPFVTNDPYLRDVLRYAEAIAVSPRAVLITGETGTGKDIIARAIHEISGRSGPYVVCNLGGLDDGLVSDALFGHRRGAFTGASSDRIGLIEAARGGTLFLDEIGDLPLQTQIKLLRLLQDGDYFTLGDDRVRRADVRIVAATSQDLDARLADDHFRRDLFYRLAAHRIHLPPLRERLGDLGPLVRHLAAKAAVAAKRPRPVISHDFLLALSQRDFPGNVRELDALLADVLARCPNGTTWTARDLLAGSHRIRTPLPEPACLTWPSSLPTLDHAIESLIGEALRRCSGNQTQVAKLLGVTKQAISYRVRKRTGS